MHGLCRRVFSTSRWSVFDMSVVSLIIVLSLFHGITTFFKIFERNPRVKIFNSSIPGHCYDTGKILKTSGAFNTISDYVILPLPIHAVYKLQMKKTKKLLVILVFTFGLWYVFAIHTIALSFANASISAPAFATIGFCGSTAEKLQQRYLVGSAYNSHMGVSLHHFKCLPPSSMSFPGTY
jgi:hypothetical protein